MLQKLSKEISQQVPPHKVSNLTEDEAIKALNLLDADEQQKVFEYIQELAKLHNE
jgi:hypothetical protein